MRKVYLSAVLVVAALVSACGAGGERGAQRVPSLYTNANARVVWVHPEQHLGAKIDVRGRVKGVSLVRQGVLVALALPGAPRLIGAHYPLGHDEHRTLAEGRVERRSVIAAGIGVPGPVDRGRGIAGSATILPGWTGVRIASEMQERLGMPVEIENDANLGALAEMTWGAGRDSSNFAYIKAATGIGAGIVIDGRLLRGASGTAGEIGHTTLDESGALC